MWFLPLALLASAQWPVPVQYNREFHGITRHTYPAYAAEQIVTGYKSTHCDPADGLGGIPAGQIRCGRVLCGGTPRWMGRIKHSAGWRHTNCRCFWTIAKGVTKRNSVIDSRVVVEGVTIQDGGGPIRLLHLTAYPRSVLRPPFWAIHWTLLRCHSTLFCTASGVLRPAS